MIRAIIIEDEKLSRELLEDILQEQYKHIQVMGSARSVKKGIEVITRTQPDLVFLDIEIIGGTAFDILRYFAKRNFEVILTTAYPQYQQQAAALGAWTYVLKPLDTEHLEQAIINIGKIIQTKRLPRIPLLNNRQIGGKMSLATTKGMYFVHTDDILYCEGERHKTHFHLTREAYQKLHIGGSGQPVITLGRTLKHFAPQLGKFGFCRPNKSLLINRKYVRVYNSATKEVTLVYTSQGKQRSKHFTVSGVYRERFLLCLSG